MYICMYVNCSSSFASLAHMSTHWFLLARCRRSNKNGENSHGDDIVVGNPLLAGHKAEVDEVCCRPQDVVCHDRLYELALRHPIRIDFRLNGMGQDQRVE